MQSKRSVIEMAEGVLKRLKSNVTSSTDIARRMNKKLDADSNGLNIFEQINNYRRKILGELPEHFSKVKRLRAMVEALSRDPATYGSIEVDLFTLQAAVSFCGVGECGETTVRAMLEMLKEGCQEPIKIIMTTGRYTYNHLFLVIGRDLSSLDSFESLDAFEQLDENYVLFDPFVGIIGEARKVKELLQDMVNYHAINRIKKRSDLDIDSSTIDYEAVLKNAKRIACLAQSYSEPVGIDPTEVVSGQEIKEQAAAPAIPTPRIAEDKGFSDQSEPFSSKDVAISREMLDEKYSALDDLPGLSTKSLRASNAKSLISISSGELAGTADDNVMKAEASDHALKDIVEKQEKIAGQQTAALSLTRLATAIENQPNQQLQQAGAAVAQKAQALLLSPRLSKADISNLQTSVTLATHVLKTATNTTAHQHSIRLLEKNVGSYPVRKSSAWQEFVSVLAMLVGAALFGLSVAGIPFTGGASVGLGCVGVGLFLGGSVGLFYHNRSKSLRASEALYADPSNMFLNPRGSGA